MRASAAVLVIMLIGLMSADAALPEAPRWLPPDTVLVVSLPDFPTAVAAFTNLPMAQLWRDPAMRGPAERLGQWWRAEVLSPLERHWQMAPAELLGAASGQVTFALLAPPGQRREWVLLAETGSASNTLTTNLARLRKTWVDSGRALRTETVRDQEALVLTLPEEILPASLRAALSARPAFDESIAPPPVTPRSVPSANTRTNSAHELRVIQTGHRLLLGSSSATLAAVLARLDQHELPVLAGQAAYARTASPLLTDAPFWGWAEARTVLELFGVPATTDTLSAETLAANPEAALFLSPGLAQLARAIGLGAMQTVTFTLSNAAAGTRFELRLVPRERATRNLLAALAGPPADLAPPPFVPAEALEFDRVRWTASNLPAALNQAFEDFSPRFGSAINFLVDTAHEAAKAKDPEFDLRAHLRAGMGEELIRWDRFVGDAGTNQSLRRVLVFPSPAPERLVQALRALFILFPQQEGEAKERAFLERTIYSVPLPPLPGSAAPIEGMGTLHYAATAGYVVLSTAESLVEEFLRQGEATAKPLKDLPGLKADREQVIGPGARAAGCWDDAVLGGAAWASFLSRPDSGAALVPFLPLPELVSRAFLEEATLPSLAEGAGLPAFDAVKPYFHRSLYALAVDSDGVTLRYFAPRPPSLPAK
jgi:hypothetical protein